MKKSVNKFMKTISNPVVVYFLMGLVILALGSSLIAEDVWLGFTLGISPVVLALLIRFSIARLAFIVVGGLFVLGSSSDLSSPKIIYALGLALSALISGIRLSLNPPNYVYFFRPLIWFGIVTAVVLFIGVLVSPNGFDFAIFARQSIFYFLILVGPLVGLDAGRDIKPGSAYLFVGIIGLLSAVGYAFDWLSRRGVSNLGSGRFVVSSLLLPAFSFGLALVLIFHYTGMFSRLFWILTVTVIPISMLVTGTRTNLVIFAVIPAVIGKITNYRVPFLRLVFIFALVGFVSFAIFPIIEAFAVSDPNFITRRIEALLRLTAADRQADLSYGYRQIQYGIANSMLAESPFFGYSLAYKIDLTLDTPLLTPVRIGWVGVIAIVSFLTAFSYGIWKCRITFGPSPGITAWWAFVVVTGMSIPFGTPLEDRGFGFTVLLAGFVISSHIYSNAQKTMSTVDCPNNQSSNKSSLSSIRPFAKFGTSNVITKINSSKT